MSELDRRVWLWIALILSLVLSFLLGFLCGGSAWVGRVRESLGQMFS